MIPESPIVFREFVMDERLPLATIHASVLKFLRGRTDVAVFGAQAVNAYVAIARMTQDVDLLSTRGELFAEELCTYLHQCFQIAVRVRTVANGSGYRIYQLRTPANRHLVDVRQIASLPDCRQVEGIQVISPPELLAMKVVSMSVRANTPKGLTDEADVLRLLLAFPEHKTMAGRVTHALERLNATEQAMQNWRLLVAREIEPDSDDDY